MRDHQAPTGTLPLVPLWMRPAAGRLGSTRPRSSLLIDPCVRPSRWAASSWVYPARLRHSASMCPAFLLVIWFRVPQQENARNSFFMLDRNKVARYSWCTQRTGHCRKEIK